MGQPQGTDSRTDAIHGARCRYFDIDVTVGKCFEIVI